MVADDANHHEPITPRKPTLVLSTSGNALVVSNSGKYLSSSKSLASQKKYVRQVTGRHNDTELHLAARRGDSAAVREIMDVIDAQMVGTRGSSDFDVEVAAIRSAMVNDVNELGETALFIAADKGHLDVVQVILFYSSTEGISLKNDLGFDAFHIAASRGHLCM